MGVSLLFSLCVKDELPVNTTKQAAATCLYGQECSAGLRRTWQRWSLSMCSHIPAVAPFSSIIHNLFSKHFPGKQLQISFTQCGWNFWRYLHDAGRPALSWKTDLGWHPRAYLGAKHPFGGRISASEAASTGMAPGAPRAPQEARHGPTVTVEFSESTGTQLGGWAALARNPGPFCIIPLWIRLPPNPKFSLCKDESCSHFFSIVARAHFPYCSSVD